MAWCIDLFSGWMGLTSTCSFWCPDPSDRSIWKWFHTTGHFARRKTLDQIQRRAYRPAWKTDTKLYCECRRACNEFHRGKPPKQAKLKPMFAGAPMEVLHVDLTGPHVNSRGYTYIMTACDAFSRYVVAAPIRNKSAITVARALVSEVILKLGVPAVHLMDLGRKFQNELWSELCQLLGIARIRTTAYCPSTNGKIERWHHSLNSMMTKVIDARQHKWVDFLPFITAAYNSTVHDATSFSPTFYYLEGSCWRQWTLLLAAHAYPPVQPTNTLTTPANSWLKPMPLCGNIQDGVLR